MSYTCTQRLYCKCEPFLPPSFLIKLWIKIKKLKKIKGEKNEGQGFPSEDTRSAKDITSSKMVLGSKEVVSDPIVGECSGAGHSSQYTEVTGSRKSKEHALLLKWLNWLNQTP